MLEVSNSLLEEALGQAMEVMAFISPLPAESNDPPQGPAMSTYLSFSGAMSGSIEVICAMRFGAILVANLLGCDVDSTEAFARSSDSLAELTNITCGTLLKSVMTDTTGLVEMAVPIQRMFDLQAWSQTVANGAVLVEAEGCVIACVVRFER